MMAGQGISVTNRFFKACGFALFIRAGLLDVCSDINQLYFVLYLHLIWGFRPKSITLTKSFVNA
jgi:hypothetical protein